MKELERWSVNVEEQVANELAATVPPFLATGEKPVWSIDTPPPYPSGKWHVGAVAGYSLIDVIARSKRMQGFDVLFPWGVDRNGINIEFTVEKKHKKPMQFWDREEFNAECAAEIKQYSDEMARIGKRIGLSCNFDTGYATDSDEYRAFSQAQFLQLFKDNLIVESLRPNTFDPKLGTSIADAEVFYEERKTRLNHVTWTVKETGEEITISTTRPELICACRMVLVHPENEATKHLIGKTAVLPKINGRSLGNSGNEEVAIGAHTHVKTDFGSGVMMVCSYGDQADVALFRELELDPIAAIGLDGRMTDAAGVGEIGPDGRPVKNEKGQPIVQPGCYWYLSPENARKQIIADLENENLLREFDTIDQKFPISERSKAAVEIVSLKEWYVKQTHATDNLRRIAQEVQFHPTKHRQLLNDWIDTVSIDWPISRRRYYHTEIPLWEMRADGPVGGPGTAPEWMEDTGPALLSHGPGDVQLEPCSANVDQRHESAIILPPFDPEAKNHTYFRPWRESPPNESRVICRACRKDLGKWGDYLGDSDSGKKWRAVGEEKVFDTWMDSSVSNLYILKDYQDAPWFADHTCSVRPQGRDIVRTWLYYTLLKSHLLKGKAGFEHAWIHGMGMDKNGRKMSKSVGNVIDPDDILKKYGSDAFRLWITGECTIGDDFRINDQKIQGTSKFLQKLGNVVNFASLFDQVERPDALHPMDEWILGELDQVTADAIAGYDELDFFNPANKVRNFVWNTFAPHYMEMVKVRAYEADRAACWTLHEVVRRVLTLLAPICPFLTHYLASNVYNLDIHKQSFPEPLGFAGNSEMTQAVEGFNSMVWKAKKDAGLSLAEAIDGIDIPEVLEPFTDVLTAMHKLGIPAE